MKNNELFTSKEGVLLKEVYYVITAQTKSLLFNEITKVVEDEFGQEIPINSTPIVASNKIFDERLRSKTIKV